MNVQELIETIKQTGAEKIEFLVPMRPLKDFGLFTFTSTDDKPVRVKCRMVEERYQLEDAYKIQVASIEPGYGKEDFYLSDFVHLINQGYISIASNR